jgi:hypothetical protein
LERICGRLIASNRTHHLRGSLVRRGMLYRTAVLSAERYDQTVATPMPNVRCLRGFEFGDANGKVGESRSVTSHAIAMRDFPAGLYSVSPKPILRRIKTIDTRWVVSLSLARYLKQLLISGRGHTIGSQAAC